MAQRFIHYPDRDHDHTGDHVFNSELFIDVEAGLDRSFYIRHRYLGGDLDSGQCLSSYVLDARYAQ